MLEIMIKDCVLLFTMSDSYDIVHLQIMNEIYLLSYICHDLKVSCVSITFLEPGYPGFLSSMTFFYCSKT
jgi:hypothetical protein